MNENKENRAPRLEQRRAVRKSIALVIATDKS